VGEDATDEIRDLLRPERIAEFGYFDPAKVGRITARLEAIKDHLATDRSNNFRITRNVVERTVLGMALNMVVTTQILEDQVRRGRFNGRAAHPSSAAVQAGAVSAAR
jgi:hypothetical protein